MFRKLFRIGLLATMIGLAGCAAERMIDPPTVAIPANTASVDVERAIVTTAVQNGWNVTERKPGQVMLRYAPRDFWVNTLVTYDSQRIVISYVDSSNLEYGQENGHAVIHPNYNRWVNNLAHDVQGQLVIEAVH